MTERSPTTAQKGKAIIIVARRLNDMRSGSSWFLKTNLANSDDCRKKNRKVGA